MLKQIDWLFLRRPIIIFLILVASSLFFYFAGKHYKDSAQELFNTAKNSLSTSHSKLKRQFNEIKLIDGYMSQYKELNNHAFIGEERRLSWLESIQASNQEIKLPKFNYSIRPQENFIRPGLKQSKNVKAMASKMDIDLGILHEEDVFNVFDLLNKHVQSYFIIEACEFSKIQKSELTVDKANLLAHCVLNWVHLKVAEQ